MRRVLVPVDQTEPARLRSAIEQVVQLCREEPTAVHLLRVQPLVSGHVAMYFDPGTLRDLQLDWGAEELQPAQSLLDAAGVPYTSSVLVGRSAKTIAAAARDYGCDRIIFGHEAPGLAERLFGSLAQQVRQILDAKGDPQVLGS